MPSPRRARPSSRQLAANIRDDGIHDGVDPSPVPSRLFIEGQYGPDHYLMPSRVLDHLPCQGLDRARRYIAGKPCQGPRGVSVVADLKNHRVHAANSDDGANAWKGSKGASR